jgi:hypothetical protein
VEIALDVAEGRCVDHGLVPQPQELDGQVAGEERDAAPYGEIILRKQDAHAR